MSENVFSEHVFLHLGTPPILGWYGLAWDAKGWHGLVRVAKVLYGLVRAAIG